VWDYSERATITQGQSPQKSSKNAIFSRGVWKTPLFKRYFRLHGRRPLRFVLFCARRAATMQKLANTRKMANGTTWSKEFPAP
jgi:hypothetical protein